MRRVRSRQSSARRLCFFCWWGGPRYINCCEDGLVPGIRPCFCFGFSGITRLKNVFSVSTKSTGVVLSQFFDIQCVWIQSIIHLGGNHTDVFWPQDDKVLNVWMKHIVIIYVQWCTLRSAPLRHISGCMSRVWQIPSLLVWTRLGASRCHWHLLLNMCGTSDTLAQELTTLKHVWDVWFDIAACEKTQHVCLRASSACGVSCLRVRLTHFKHV